MFDAQHSRRTFLPLTVLLLVLVAIMLVPFSTSAAGSFNPARPGQPPRIMSLPKPAAGSIVLTATATGWYNNRGFHDGTNSNYIVGDCISLCSAPYLGLHIHNYFVFDLSGVVGTITGATLVAADPFDNPPFTPYTLYAVQSSISYVEASQTSATNIYHDLGAGTVYGSIIPAVNTGVQTVPLNGAGVLAVQRAEAAQQQIAFGGAMPTPSSSNGLLFGGSGGNLSQIQLVLTVR